MKDKTGKVIDIGGFDGDAFRYLGTENVEKFPGLSVSQPLGYYSDNWKPKKKAVTVKTSNQGIEEEQALIIRSDDPEEVVLRMSELEKFSWYRLFQQPDQHIIDTYYNTAASDLKKSSLRIRNVNGKDFVTIKGKNVGFNSEQTRTEFEVAWPWETPSALDVANLFELVPVQSRITHRIVRDIVPNYKKKDPDPDNVVAELAIDEVTYLFNNGKEARFFEVEVELKGSHNTKLSSIVDSLMGKVPELRKWKHSKLSTGKVLDLALGIQTDETDLVTDSSFDVIAKLAEALS